jgi:hypothetical protein
MMGRYSEEPRFAFDRDENIRAMQYTRSQGQKLDPWCEINKHIFVFINLCSLYIMMCIIFPITVRLLQNNERGFL